MFINEIIKRYVNSENVFFLFNILGNMGISYLFIFRREIESFFFFFIFSMRILSVVGEWLYK